MEPHDVLGLCHAILKETSQMNDRRGLLSSHHTRPLVVLEEHIVERVADIQAQNLDPVSNGRDQIALLPQLSRLSNREVRDTLSSSPEEGTRGCMFRNAYTTLHFPRIRSRGYLADTNEAQTKVSRIGDGERAF